MKEKQPQPPEFQRRPLSKRERKRQAKITRRRLFGLSLVAVIGLPLAAAIYANRAAFLGQRKEEEFTGEADQTKAYLKKWEDEVKGLPELPEEYFPKIADLATAFFSRQMGYDKERFKNNIVFQNEDEFSTIAYDKSCNDIPSPAVGASTPIDKEKIAYIRKKRINKANSPLLTAFSYVLHELHHVSAPLEKYDPPIQIIGLDKPVSYKRGLLAAVLRDGEKNTPEKECIDLYTYRINLEEAVVQDSTDRLLLLLEIAMSHDYKEWVSLYRDSVLNRFYNGDNKELLSYQQKTQSSSFFQSVGEKLGIKEPHEQIDAGDNYLKSLFNPRP